jgi:hypothetical protein
MGLNRSRLPTVEYRQSLATHLVRTVDVIRPEVSPERRPVVGGVGVQVLLGLGEEFVAVRVEGLLERVLEAGDVFEDL